MPKKIDTEPLYDGDGPSPQGVKMNAGFQYELDLIKKLREEGFTVSDPAGADSAKADLELTPTYKNQIIKFELKEKLSADFAQMNFDFDNCDSLVILKIQIPRFLDRAIRKGLKLS